MPVEDGEQHHYNTSFCTIVAHCAFWTLVTNFDPIWTLVADIEFGHWCPISDFNLKSLFLDFGH